MTEWVTLTGSRSVWDADLRRAVHLMVPLYFAELTWRYRHASPWRYARWFERHYGLDLEGYLAGYDDAGAGLPSAVSDPEHHAACEAALLAGDPIPGPAVSVAASGDGLAAYGDGLPF